MSLEHLNNYFIIIGCAKKPVWFLMATSKLHYKTEEECGNLYVEGIAKIKNKKVAENVVEKVEENAVKKVEEKMKEKVEKIVNKITKKRVKRLEKEKRKRVEKKVGEKVGEKVEEKVEYKIVQRKLHAVLTYKMENSQSGCINRDENAVRNMIKIVNHQIDHKCRPLKYRRDKIKQKSVNLVEGEVTTSSSTERVQLGGRGYILKNLLSDLIMYASPNNMYVKCRYEILTNEQYVSRLVNK